jgi:hypothetical protein
MTHNPPVKQYVVLDSSKPFIASLVDAMFQTHVMEDFMKENRREIVEAIKRNPAFLEFLRSQGIIPSVVHDDPPE